MAAAVPEQRVYLGRGEVGAGCRGEQLDRVHGAGAQLDLLGRAVLEQLAGFDRLLQGGVESQDAVDAEDVRDEVVGEGGEPVAVLEGGDAGAVEVGGGDLGALEERDRPTLVLGDVGEGAPGGEPVGEGQGRAVGRVREAREISPSSTPTWAPTLRSERAKSSISGCPGSWPSTAAISAAPSSTSSVAAQGPPPRKRSTRPASTVE